MAQPIPPAAETATDATMPAPEATMDSPQDASGGYCIELKVMTDGSMSIGVEPAKPDDESTEGDYQPVKSIGEAMRVIKDIVANAGNMGGMNENADLMEAGYGKAGGL